MIYMTDHNPLGLRHIAFAALLATLLAVSLILAASSSGPVILGTELNTNGQVEYMCLGNGCEDFRSFNWVD